MTIMNDNDTHTGGTYRHELKPSERRDYSTAYRYDSSIKLMMDGKNAHFPSHAVMETCMEIRARELRLLIGNHMPAVSNELAIRARQLSSGYCNFTNDADMYAFLLNIPVSQLQHGLTNECIDRALSMLASLPDKSYFAHTGYGYNNDYCLIGQLECIANMLALGVSEDDIRRTLNYACEPDNMLTRMAVIGKSYDAYTVMALERIMQASNASTNGLLLGKPSDNEYIFDYCWYHSETELLARIAGEDWKPDDNLINPELPITLAGLKAKSWEQFDLPEWYARKHDDLNSIPHILIDASCVFSQMKAYDDVSASTCIALRARLNSLIGVLFDEIGYDNAGEIIKLVNNLIEHSDDKDDDGNFIITNQLLSYPVEFIAQKLMTYYC